MSRFERWDAATALSRLEDLLGVYREAFLEVFEADPSRAAADRRLTMRRHLDEERLATVVALDGDRVVGFAYGYPGRSGQWWHDVVASGIQAAFGASEAARWLADCFEVVELHVLPCAQGHGLGRTLLSGLLDGRGERTAALSALDDPALPARRLYASAGFRALLERFRFPGGDKDFAVLVRDLPA